MVGRGGGARGGVRARGASGPEQKWPEYVPDIYVDHDDEEMVRSNHAVCIAMVPKRLCVCPEVNGHEADVCFSQVCGADGQVNLRSG